MTARLIAAVPQIHLQGRQALTTKRGKDGDSGLNGGVEMVSLADAAGVDSDDVNGLSPPSFALSPCPQTTPRIVRATRHADVKLERIVRVTNSCKRSIRQRWSVHFTATAVDKHHTIGSTEGRSQLLKKREETSITSPLNHPSPDGQGVDVTVSPTPTRWGI